MKTRTNVNDTTARVPGRHSRTPVLPRPKRGGFFHGSRMQWITAGLVFLAGALVLIESLAGGGAGPGEGVASEAMPLVTSVEGAWGFASVGGLRDPGDLRDSNPRDSGRSRRDLGEARGSRGDRDKGQRGRLRSSEDERSTEDPRGTEPETLSDDPGKSPRDSQVYQIYVVRDGDSLWSIAQRWLGQGAEWSRLAEANPDVDPERLREGTEIRIPVSGPRNSRGLDQAPRTDPPVRRHVVAPGESLYTIARRYRPGESWEWLHRANHDLVPDPSKVKIGTELRIP